MSNRLRFLLDAVTFVAMLLANSPVATGIAMHEWLSIALASALFVHVVVNWDWCVRTATQLFKKMLALRRINLVVDVLLFCTFIAVMLTGLLESKAVASALGLQMAMLPAAKLLHGAAAEATIILLAIHAGLHWSWIARVAKSLFRADEPGKVHAAAVTSLNAAVKTGAR